MNRAAAVVNARFQVVLLAGERGKFDDYIAHLKTDRISYIDCRLDEFTKREYQLPDGHPNAKMNSLIADCIKQELEDEISGFEHPRNEPS